MPGAARHPDRERRAGFRPGEDVKLREVPPRLRVVVRPPRSGAVQHEARGVHRQDLLDRPEGFGGLREQVLQGTRDPVAAVVLLQRVEVREAGESEGRLEELEEAHRATEAQVEVRPDEEAQDEVPRNPRKTLAPLPVVDRRGLDEVPQEEAGEADLIALPAVVLRPVPATDTPAWLGQWGIPSQVLVADPTEELATLGLNGYATQEDARRHGLSRVCVHARSGGRRSCSTSLRLPKGDTKQSVG